MAQGTNFEGFGFSLRSGDLSGSQLMLAAQRGDAAAFQELVRSYDAMVMGVVLALTGSEDTAQVIYKQIFLDAFASMNKLDCGSSVFIWLYRILVKHCLEYCRLNQPAATDCQERGALPTLAASLRCLPPAERVVVLLKHSQELKIRTLAEIFACPQEYIAEVLRKGTHSLRTLVALRARQIA